MQSLLYVESCTPAVRGCRLPHTSRHTHSVIGLCVHSHAQKGGGTSTSHVSCGGAAARRRGRLRAFDSFWRDNAGLATLGHAIEGRNVTVHFTVSIKGAKATIRMAGTCRYAKLARPSVSHARKRSAGPPSGPATRAPWALTLSATSVLLCSGSARSGQGLAGTTSAWRGCSASATENHMEASTELQCKHGGADRYPHVSICTRVQIDTWG